LFCLFWDNPKLWPIFKIHYTSHHDPYAMTFRTIVDQFFDTIGQLRAAVDLIRDRQLWRGIDRYNWLVKVMVGVAIILGLSFLGEVFNWISSLFRVESPQAFFSTMGSLVSGVATEGYESFTSGIMKYVILLLSEVIIFHFMQRALEEIHGSTIRTDFQTFLVAQIRMLQVVIRVWVLELVVTTLISVAGGILGIPGWIESVVTFTAQCYFFGLVILDNYHEQFGLTIKESMVYSQQFTGVALALGMVLYVLMLLPLVGVVGGTVLVSVTAVLVMGKLAPVGNRKIVAHKH